MAGHSKWAQIKRQKAVTDGARARVFARFARLITLEAKKAAGNTNDPGLKAAIERAKKVNMPKENIERAVAKGTSKDASSLEQVTYECYGPGGAAIIVDALTDNRNRTTQELKHLLSKNELELAAPGSALWAFQKHPDGSFTPHEPLTEVDASFEDALSALLSLLDEHDDVQRVFTNARGYETTESDDEA